jgi:polyhydroxyalkanoate synthesis repressor PhaR
MDEKMRVIKRYSNRKLYDMKDSRYITLEKIAEYVKKGQEIQVVDNQTGEDLTAVILSQILFEQEKSRRGGFLPVSTLQSILQSGEQVLKSTIGAPMSSVKEGVGAAGKMVTDLVEEADRALGRVVRKGTDVEAHVVAMRTAMTDLVQKRMEEFVAGIDGRIKQLNETTNRVTASLKDMEALKKRLDEVEKLLKKQRPQA